MSFISKSILQLIGFGYGLFMLSMFLVIGISEGKFFQKPTEDSRRALATARKKLWDLREKPYGMHHQFYETRGKRRMHYVVSKLKPAGDGNLVIFIHGFPDSWAIWRRQLTSAHLQNAGTLVAIDLPNYGGSDSFPSPSAEAMLEAVTELIIALGERYDGKGRTVVVTHDWGSVFGFRLAAEAHQVADRFIICSVMQPSLTRANAQQRVQTAIRIFKEFTRRPSEFKLVRNALYTVGPVLAQLRKSGYIFVFNLPAFLTAYAGRMGNTWFLRLMHRLAETREDATTDPVTLAAEAMAISVGPGPEQKSAGDEGLSYSEAVFKRTSDGGWMDKITLYRDGAAAKRWNKSPELTQALQNIERNFSGKVTSTALTEGPRGSLKAPTTVVMGANDPAFDMTLALEGIADYFVPSSQLVMLKDSGHWLPLEEAGHQFLEQIILWSVQGEKGNVQEAIRKVKAPGGIEVKVDV